MSLEDPISANLRFDPVMSLSDGSELGHIVHACAAVASSGEHLTVGARLRLLRLYALTMKQGVLIVPVLNEPMLRQAGAELISVAGKIVLALTDEHVVTWSGIRSKISMLRYLDFRIAVETRGEFAGLSSVAMLQPDFVIVHLQSLPRGRVYDASVRQFTNVIHEGRSRVIVDAVNSAEDADFVRTIACDYAAGDWTQGFATAVSL